jgi:hypothetical protein
MERKPVAHANAVRPNAFYPCNARRQLWRQQPVVGGLDSELPDRRNPDNRDGAESPGFERHPPGCYCRLGEPGGPRLKREPGDEFVERLTELSEELLQQFDTIFGLHPGFRPAHAKGAMLTGSLHLRPAPTTSPRTLYPAGIDAGDRAFLEFDRPSADSR